METKTNEPAYHEPAYPNIQVPSLKGLTKREYFAAMALQGIISNKDGLDIKIERIVESAVDTADALIEELNKTK
jgi:hypothetical protein